MSCPGRIVLIASAVAASLTSGGCGGSLGSPPEVPRVVFVCKESGEVFVGPARPTPAVHPVTGKATIMPGLYSPQKQVWMAAPPLETQQRSAAQSTNPAASRLQREGPIPDTATPF